MSRAIRIAAGTKKRFVVLVVTLLAVGGGVAFAYFTSLGAGSGVASVGSLSAPTLDAPVPGAGTVDLSWSAITPPQADTVTYTVTRGAGEGAIDGTCTGSLSGTTCTDSGLTAGTYHYTVTAHWRTWTAGSGTQSVALASGAATKLVFTTAPKTLVVGQTSDTITVQRQDVAGNPVTVGAATVNLASDSGTGVFRDTGDTISITSTTIPDGSSDTGFLYRDSHAGSPTITASSGTLTSGTQIETINPAATATGLVSGTNPSVTGQSVTLTATVSATAPGAGTPTGTVAFKDGGTTIPGCGTVTLSSGQADCTTSWTASQSTRTLTAVYSGSGDFSGSTSGTVTQTINPAATSTGLVSGTNPSVTGQSVTLTATVSASAPGAGTPTGTVAFKDGGATISGCGAIALVGGQASCPTSWTASQSTRSLTAVYSGNADFSISTSATVTQTINTAATTTTVISSLQPSNVGDSVTFTATIAVTAPGSATTAPTGTVNFKDGGSTISGCGTQAVGGTGPYTATCTTGALAKGSHTITAVYSGDTNFNGSTSAGLTQTVNSAILYVGASSVASTTSSGTPIAVTYPAGTTTGDFVLLIMSNSHHETPSCPASPWALRTTLVDGAGGGGAKEGSLVTCSRFAGAETSVTVTSPGGAGKAFSARVVVFRNVSTTTPFDTADTTSAPATLAASTFVAPALTTVTANAMAVSVAMQNDATQASIPTLDFSGTGGLPWGFTWRFSNGVISGGTETASHAAAVATKTVPSAGAVTFPTWTTNVTATGSIWLGISLALRPAP